MKKLLALCVAVLCLIVVSQRLVAWPVPYAWQVGVGAAEWGHWVGLFCLFLGLLRRELALRVVCALAAGIGLAPLFGAVLRDPAFSLRALVLGLSDGSKPSLELNLPTGQKADLYLPARLPAPGVFVVHGGSWARGSRKEFAGLNGYLRAHGYLVAALDYSLAPAHPYPAAPNDLDGAYDYLVEHAGQYGLDPSRIAWLGRSAGAQLALVEAYSRRPSQAVIAFYPPTDMVWSYQHPSNPRVLDSCAALRDFLGGTPSEQPQRYRESSPLDVVQAGAPPTLLLHGQADDLVYVEQSRRLARRLRELNVPCTLEEYPWANHGFDINLNGPSGQLSTLAVERFLERWLKH